MNLVRATQRTITWLILALYLLAGCIRSQPLVLCVGPDGHVAIEIAHQGTRCDGCSEAGPARDGQEPASRVVAGGCCPCIDYPLSGSRELTSARTRAACQHASLAELAAQAPIAVAGVPPRPSGPSRARGATDPPPPRETGPISHLRTRVLRR